MSATPASMLAWDEDDRRRPVAVLPDPEALIRNLTRGVLEVHAGVREPAQLARFLAHEPYQRLVEHSLLAARGRGRHAGAPVRPVYDIVSVRWTAPATESIEAAVVVAAPDRVRAVTMRLEASGSRWRATSIVVV